MKDQVKMAYTHPFDIELEKYLLENSRQGWCMEGDLGRVQEIQDIESLDLKENLECNNLAICGQATKIISDDCEVLLHVNHANTNRIDFS